MTYNKGKTRVVLVLTILLVSIVLAQTISSSRLAIANCEVRDFGLTSQTYTDHAAISIDGNADFVYSLDGDSTNSDLYPIVDSAGTIPVTTTSTGNEFPIEMIAFAAIGVVLVLLVVVALLKRRN